MVTEFELQCADWTDGDLPISYQFYYVYDSSLLDVAPQHLLSPVSNSTNLTALLPAGHLRLFAVIRDRHNFAHTEEVQVLDRVNSSPVVVAADPALAANFGGYIEDLIARLDATVEEGDLAGAMQLVIPFASLMVSAPEEAAYERMTMSFEAEDAAIFSILSALQLLTKAVESPGLSGTLLEALKQLTVGNKVSLSDNTRDLAIEVFAVASSAFLPAEKNISNIQEFVDTIMDMTVNLMDTGGCDALTGVTRLQEVVKKFLNDVYSDTQAMERGDTVMIQEEDFTVESVYMNPQGGRVSLSLHFPTIPSCEGHGIGYWVHSVTYDDRFSACWGREVLSPVRDVFISCQDGVLANVSNLGDPIVFSIPYDQVGQLPARAYQA